VSVAHLSGTDAALNEHSPLAAAADSRDSTTSQAAAAHGAATGGAVTGDGAAGDVWES
jgi:hypothetical protein